MLKSLFKPKWQHKTPAVRIQAIGRLQAQDANDQDIIKQLLQQDPDVQVRIHAAKHCLDIELLNQSLAHADEALTLACTEQICGLLMAPPAGLSDGQVLKFIAQSADARVLQHLIECGQDSRLCSEALLHINDQSVIAYLSQNSKSSQQRQTAAQLLQAPELIQQVLSQSKGKDKKVTQILKDKIKQHKLENQQQAANQSAIVEVLSKLNQLSKTEQQAQLNAKLGLLQQQWQDLNPSAEQQQNFEQLQGQCQSLVDQQAQLDAQQREQLEQQREAHLAQQALLEQLEQQLSQLGSTAEDLDLAQQQQGFEQLQQAWQAAQQPYPAKPQTKLGFSNAERKVAQLLPALNQLAAKQAQIQAAITPSESDNTEFKALQQALRQNQKLLRSIHWPEDLELPPNLAKLKQNIEQLQQELATLEQQQQQIKHTLQQQLKQLEQDTEAGSLDKAKAAMGKIRQNYAKLDQQHSKELQYGIHQAQQALNELKDWQQYATGPKREALCEQMEQLAQTKLPPHAKNQAIKELQQNWRELGNDQHSKTLWQRFKAATDEAYAPCKAEFEKEKALRLYNGQQRSEICQQLESYLQQVDFSQVSFADVDKLYRHAADEWKRFAPVERSEHKALQDRFNQPMSQLKQALQQHKSDNIAAKQTLVERAQALIEQEDCQQAINEAKQLQQNWKAIGLSFQKQNQQLWGEFRQACDALFERRNQEQQTAKGEREQNLKQAQQISAAILELSQADGEELQRNQKQVQQLVQQFNNLGALPKQDYQAAKSQFHNNLDTFNQRVKGIAARQQQKALQALIASAEKLEQIEAANGEQQQALIAGFMIPPELPDSWQDQLNRRLQQSQSPSGESNQDAFELLCIQLEIACEQDSPSAYQQQRMQYQMQQLSESFGQAKGHDFEQRVSELVINWCQLSSSGCEPYTELKQRFFKLALNQLKAD